MTIKKSVSIAFSKYATFSGRASRSEYWYFYLFTFLVGMCTNIIDKHIGLEIQVVSCIASLVLLLPSLAVGVRRCHDSGHSGWWIICPIYNLVLMFFPSDPTANAYGEMPE